VGWARELPADAPLALMKAYFEGAERQRALSFWSIGSWGGSGLSPLFGGFVASTIGWRWIFWMSIVVAVVSLLLLRGTPESKAEATIHGSFDWTGVIASVIAMVSLNILIGQGSVLGRLSPAVLILGAVFILSIILFVRIELGNASGFVDLTLFRNTIFSGATLSNFLLNRVAGTLLVVLTLVQEAAGLSSLESGLLTVGIAGGDVPSTELPAATAMPRQDYVRLTVEDTGLSMSHEVMARAFEPFFSTKAEGRGTGLGLAFVYAAMRRIGGFVEISSTVDVGTTFALWLPRASQLSTRLSADRAERR